MAERIFTSESVGDGHPDKVCDQISDAILDHFLSLDPYARVALESVATTNKIVLLGEVRGPSSITHDVLRDIARQTVKRIGYQQEGFHWRKNDIDVYVHQQSSDIAQGVDETNQKSEGAGDQGIMFGYASNETDVLMPAPLHYAHTILKSIARDRHSGKLEMLGPDAKSQVSVKYQDGRPVGVTAVVVSTQHVEGVSQQEVRDIVRPYVEKALPDGWMCDDQHFYVNPTGRFVIGGPDGDTGLTGRKIIVDSYGGAAPHGGGAFSGKDPTKVDRSAAYMARYLAKNIVAAKLADRCTIQLSYAIGVAEPISIYVDTHGTSRLREDVLVNLLRELVSLTPRGIREHLKLNRPIYLPTASYGHFGRVSGEGVCGEESTLETFTWEKLDLVDALHKHKEHLFV